MAVPRKTAICFLLFTVYLISGAGTLAIVIFDDRNSKKNKLHSILGLVATIITGKAMMIYRLYRNRRTRNLKFIHMALHLMAFIMILISIGSYLLKSATPISHQGHALSGYALVGGYIVHYLLSIIMFFCVGRNNNTRIYFSPIHDIYGIWIFAFMVGCCISGYEEELSDFRALGYMIAYTGFLIVIGVVLSPYFDWSLKGRY